MVPRVWVRSGLTEDLDDIPWNVEQSLRAGAGAEKEKVSSVQVGEGSEEFHSWCEEKFIDPDLVSCVGGMPNWQVRRPEPPSFPSFLVDGKVGLFLADFIFRHVRDSESMESRTSQLLPRDGSPPNNDNNQ